MESVGKLEILNTTDMGHAARECVVVRKDSLMLSTNKKHAPMIDHVSPMAGQYQGIGFSFMSGREHLHGISFLDYSCRR